MRSVSYPTGNDLRKRISLMDIMGRRVLLNDLEEVAWETITSI